MRYILFSLTCGKRSMGFVFSVLLLLIALSGIGNAATVIATIPVGLNPRGVWVDPSTNRVYVANTTDNTVSVINGTTNTVIATIPVGWHPEDVGVNSLTNRIYIANQYGDTVSVIDGSTNTVIATIVVKSYLRGVGVNPFTNRIYVANNESGTISVIDVTTNTMSDIIPAGVSYSWDVGVNPLINRIYVTSNLISANANTVSVIEDSSTTETMCVPESISVSPANLALMTNDSSDVEITVTDEDGCPAEGVTVKATTKRVGSKRITISPLSVDTDTDGKATFIITAKNAGKARVKFTADSLSKAITVEIKK